MKITSLILLSVLASMSAMAQSVYPGLYPQKFKIHNIDNIKASSFSISDVTLLPSRFTQNAERNKQWILSIDVNRLLHSFRTSAGVFAGHEGGYSQVEKLGGWESLDCDIRGHSTGHLLSAMALIYGSTRDQRLKLKADSVVSGLAEVQQKLGSGFLAAFPEGLVDRNIAAQRVWVPWYTIHKILAGLIDQYIYCDNAQALEMATKMANWAYAKLSPLSEQTRVNMLRNEFGGIGESFYNLYTITADKNYRWLAKFFFHNQMMTPLENSVDDLAGKHANTFIPKVITEARNYEISGDTLSRKRAEYFWRNVVANHSFCTGSNSDKEKFFDHNKLAEHLSGYTGETCNTYNMLKLTKHLFCWNPNPEYVDYYERALFNHILGQQDPNTGMVAYFLPMLSGAHKVYSTKDESFWCCVGTGFENHAKYGEAIYFYDNNSLYVNLFISSVLNWKDKGMTVTQQTDFPQSDITTLTISTSVSLKTTIKLRYPSWSNGAKVRINGKNVAIKRSPGSYIALERVWKDGDKIEFQNPMTLRMETTPDDSLRGALVFGPLVLAGELGCEGMIAPAPHSNPQLHNDYYGYDYNIPAQLNKSLHIDKTNIGNSIRRVDGTLRFVSTDGKHTISPLYDIHRQRYVIYWNLID